MSSFPIFYKIQSFIKVFHKNVFVFLISLLELHLAKGLFQDSQGFVLRTLAHKNNNIDTRTAEESKGRRTSSQLVFLNRLVINKSTFSNPEDGKVLGSPGSPAIKVDIDQNTVNRIVVRLKITPKIFFLSRIVKENLKKS